MKLSRLRQLIPQQEIAAGNFEACFFSHRDCAVLLDEMCLSKRAYSERGPIGQQKIGYPIWVPFGKESSLSYRLEKACYRKRSAYAAVRRPETLLFNKAYSFEEYGLPALILISLLCRYSSMNSAVSYSEYSTLSTVSSDGTGFSFLK